MYFMSYRRFYVWRARYHYFIRDVDGWTLISLLLLFCMGMLAWGYWRALNLPPPRVHPEAAALRVEGLTKEAIHRIVLVRHGGTSPGQELQTHAEIRANTLRTLRVRQTLRDQVALQFKADLLADMADYIDATGGCFPYECLRVMNRIDLVQRAAADALALNDALATVLEVPPHLLPNLEGTRARLRSGWSDDFNDVYYYTWLLRDLQQMHAAMMHEYPHRAPAPWLARLLTFPVEEPVGFPR